MKVDLKNYFCDLPFTYTEMAEMVTNVKRVVIDSLEET